MSNTAFQLAAGLDEPRPRPERPDAAARRGRSVGQRNASAGNGRGNGGSEAPWHYQRRISTLGPLEPRDKHFRAEYLAAVAHQQLTHKLGRTDAAGALVLLDMTHGGLRDYRVTEAEIARRLPLRADGEPYSKRVASDVLDRLRAAGLVDWDHGTYDDFHDPHRRTLLSGRWQGPPIYRLTIPADVHQLIRARAGAARSEAMRARRQGGRTTERRGAALTGTGPISKAEERRRQAQANAAAIAQLATTETLEQGLVAIYEQYGGNRDLLDAATEQFERTWHQARARGPT